MTDPTSPSQEIVLETHDLTVAYDKKPVLYGIDVSIAPGQLVGIMGPNGAGKSTTIGIVTSLVNRSSGSIEVFGINTDDDLAGAKRLIGIVPQELNINQFGANILQAREAPSSDSYLFKDYLQVRTSRGQYARDEDNDPSELMPIPPTSYRERPLSYKEHGADNYMFMLKYLQNNPNPTIASFRNEPALVYASVSLQAGGGDEFPLEWPTGTEGIVHQLTGPGDHVDAGNPPHPFSRDGFRVRWLDETASNKGVNNELFLQEAPLGNWNLRASYICRNPYDNLTNRAP